ncbi:MAG: sulfur transferase domain-containing protein, partial [Caulobacteraceae bacterium]
VGPPTEAQVAAVRMALAATDGKAVAYCRSGTRSITTWALGRPADERKEAVRRAAEAGFDLSGILP